MRARNLGAGPNRRPGIDWGIAAAAAARHRAAAGGAGGCHEMVSLAGPPVDVGVTMYVLSISSLSEVQMVRVSHSRTKCRCRSVHVERSRPRPRDGARGPLGARAGRPRARV